MVAGLEDVERRRDPRWADRLVNDVDPSERDIAMVFQNYALYPHMTVCENIAFPLQDAPTCAARGTPAAGARRCATCSGSRRCSIAAGAAVRRPAPARRARRARSCASRSVPDGRAALEPRRAAPLPDAGSSRELCITSSADHDLRDARPGRGDDGRRPRGSHAATARCCSWATPRRSTTGPPICSLPRSSEARR